MTEHNHSDTHRTQIVVVEHNLYPEYLDLCMEYCWDCKEYIGYWSREKEAVTL